MLRLGDGVEGVGQTAAVAAGLSRDTFSDGEFGIDNAPLPAPALPPPPVASPPAVSISSVSVSDHASPADLTDLSFLPRRRPRENALLNELFICHRRRTSSVVFSANSQRGCSSLLHRRPVGSYFTPRAKCPEQWRNTHWTRLDGVEGVRGLRGQGGPESDPNFLYILIFQVLGVSHLFYSTADFFCERPTSIKLL